MTTSISPHPRRWTREEYNRFAERGIFGPEEKLELINGVIYKKPKQSPRHAAGICALEDSLTLLFSERYDVRPQFPLALGYDSEPEPDIAIVQGHWSDYVDSHPTTAILIVEVADSSLYHDRKRKGSLYARAGIPEYWILNLVRKRLEVYRDPKNGTYTSRSVLRDGDSICPLARPEASISVANMLP